MKKLRLILLSVIIAATAVIFAGCNETEINVKEISDFSLTGINGNGTVTANFSRSKADAVITSDMDKTKVLNAMESLQYEISGGKNGKLKNGETITINITCDEKLEKEAGIKFSNTAFVYTVDGLNEGTIIDPFKDIKISYTGTAPNAQLKIDATACDEFIRKYVTFKSEPATGFYNGDKIKVSAVCDKNVLLAKDYMFSKEEQEYTAEGLSEYAKSFKNIDRKEVNNLLKKDLESYLKERGREFDWTKDEELDKNWAYDAANKISYDVKGSESYYSINKDNPSDNSYTCVYKVTATITVPAKTTKDPETGLETASEEKKFKGTLYFTQMVSENYVENGKIILHVSEYNDKPYIEAKDYKSLKDAQKALTSGENFNTEKLDYI